MQGTWGMPGLMPSRGAQMLEPIFGWEDLFKSRPKLGAYYAAVQADPVGARVRLLLLWVQV